MFDTLKTKWRLYRLNKRYEKLLEDAGRRYLKQKDEALAYRIEEADRKTEATLSYYHNNIKNN